MQFTTMRGMKMPRDEYSEGTKACMSICRMVTNEAITTMNAGMRTSPGIALRSAEMAPLEHTSTKSVAIPMDRPVMAVDVVPKVGHMPRMSTNVGLRRIIPSKITRDAFIVRRR